MSGAPHRCPACQRIFAWGADEESALVDVQGQQWLSCRENASWKLRFHMKQEHPDRLTKCPRRDDAFAPVSAYPTEDYWYERDHHRVCSYCGSMHPDDFFGAVEKGYELGPTDKNYKVYVDLPNPEVGKTIEVGNESGPAYDMATGEPKKNDLTENEKKTGRYSRPIFGTAPATIHANFYFQHLSVEQRHRFIELLNANKINIGYPGYFYRLPFFAVRTPKVSETAGSA